MRIFVALDNRAVFLNNNGIRETKIRECQRELTLAWAGAWWWENAIPEHNGSWKLFSVSAIWWADSHFIIYTQSQSQFQYSPGAGFLSIYLCKYRCKYLYSLRNTNSARSKNSTKIMITGTLKDYTIKTRRALYIVLCSGTATNIRPHGAEARSEPNLPGGQGLGVANSMSCLRPLLPPPRPQSGAGFRHGHASML